MASQSVGDDWRNASLAASASLKSPVASSPSTVAFGNDVTASLVVPMRSSPGDEEQATTNVALTASTAAIRIPLNDIRMTRAYASTPAPRHSHL